MCLAILSRRVQMLIDEERYERLERRAEERGASVAALIREAIDQAFPAHGLVRRAAADALLETEPMPVDDWPVIKRQMLADRYGGIES